MKIKTSHLILLQGLLMLLFLTVTAWFNRFSADDYFCIGEIKNHSFFDIYQKLYLSWTGRWTLYFVILFFMQFNANSYFLFAIGVLSFLMLFFSIYSVLNQMRIRLNANYSKVTVAAYAMIFIGVFFFFTHITSQSWFWISASLAYLWSCIFFLWGLNSFLKNAPHIFDYLIMVFCGLYIGGSNEVLALMVILLLFVSFFFIKKKTKIIVTLVSITFSFGIYISSPGTAFRDGLTPNLPFVDLILYVGYGSIKYLVLDGYKTILPAIVFAYPFYVLGATTTTNFSTKFSLKQELIKTVLFVVLVVVVNQFIVIYALGGLAPDRATIASSLLGSLALVRFMFLFGNANKESNINFKPIIGLVVLLLVGFNIVFFTIHYNYSKSVDERMTYIQSIKNIPVIELKKLENSGYINSAEITTDSTHFLNQHLKYGLGIKGQLVLKQD